MSPLTQYFSHPIPFIGTNLAPVMLINNPNSHNPTWQEMYDFVIVDETDKLEYIAGEFECPDFAITLHNNFERVGIRCAIVQLNIPLHNGHLICAVMTTDKGLRFIEPQENLEMNKKALLGFMNSYLGFLVRSYYLFW